ncbi:MAG TPA: hypothetical protein VFI02_06455, partial [Armatimonadota bacterium]|nr:hypothetical protein [Armatimonadota bacterium]
FGEAERRINSVLKYTQMGKEEKLPSFMNDAVNQQREERLIKAILRPYLDTESAAYPDVYDEANDLMKVMYGEDLPEEYLFTTDELDTLKAKAQKRRDAEAADVKAQQQEIATQVERQIRGWTRDGLTKVPGTDTLILDVIDEADYLSPALQDTLANGQQAIIDGGKKKGTPDDETRWTARNQVLAQIGTSLEAAEKMLNEKVAAGELTFADAKELDKTLHDTDISTKAPRYISDLETTFDAVRNLEVMKIESHPAWKGTSQKALAEQKKLAADLVTIDVIHNKTKAGFYKWLTDNPGATETEVFEKQRITLNPVVQDAVRDLVTYSHSPTFTGTGALGGSWGKWATPPEGSKASAPKRDRTDVPPQVPDDAVKWFRALNLEEQTMVRNRLATMSWEDFKAEFIDE